MNGFTYKYRGADSQVRRTFACTSCGIEWTLWQEREAVFPDCPMQRAAELTRALEVPALSTVSPGGVPSQAEMANSFWGGGMPGVPAALAPQVGAAFQGAAMANARLTRAEGFDPMALLHQKKPPFKLDIVAATNRRPAS